MKVFDFEFDNLYLSDLGYTLCTFNSDGFQTVSNGSQITFNTVPTLNGTKHELTSSTYETCIESTFQICKRPCDIDNIEISVDELRELMSWLNRKTFCKFRLLDDKYFNLYFEASFNVSKIQMNDKIYGLELQMITNRPYALLIPRTIVLKNFLHNGKKTLVDVSDEEGFIYPETEITIQESGDLRISNSLEQRVTIIKNCVKGEVIKMNYPIIESSLNSHKIQNDFNWEFLRIANKYRDKKNIYTISIPCEIKLTYSPIAKVGI